MASMSRATSQLGDIERGNGSGNVHFGRPRSVSFHTPRGGSGGLHFRDSSGPHFRDGPGLHPRDTSGLHFRDSSGLLFTMYSKIAEEEDNKMTERWQADADGILIFAGLFSAVVAQLLSVTVQSLNPGPQPQPQPQGNSEFYLKNICQALSNQSDLCQPPPSPVLDSSTFSPSTSAIWVNSLWFLSVVISLTCAMLATFVQKWARRYIGITQPSRYSPDKRARLRAFFSDGVDKWHVSWAVEALPTLLHLSLFLFFVGLVIYLFSINHYVFGSVVWWVVLSKMAYLCITLLPIFRPNCPYYAPLSSPIWYLCGSIRYALIKFLSSPVIGYFHFDTADHFRRLKTDYSQFFEDIGRTAEEYALKQASEIDVRVLQSTFDAHDEAGAQEEFFRAIPGFFESKLVYGLEEHLTGEFRVKFSEALTRFLDRTVSLSSLSESARSGRLVICLNAARAALGFDGVSQILWDILNGRWPELVQSVDMVQSLRKWSNTNDRQFISYVQRVVAQVVVDVRDRDERWISLVKSEFAVPDRVLRTYIPHGDSVLLAILIHMTRQASYTGSWTQWVLSSLSGFDIDDTIPGLQHVFCDLWNDILLRARDLGDDNTYVNILREIRHAYIDLHRRTDAAPTFTAATFDFDPVLVQPRSYRYCNIASHRQDLTNLTVHTPVRASAVIPSPTRLSGWPDVFPRPSPSRHYRTPGASTASLEPSPDHTPHHTQEFTWPSPTADLVHIYTQPPSISGSSVHESIRTAITLDPALLVPREASPDPHQSADDQTPQTHTSESGDIFLAPVASSLIFQRSDPVLVTMPSTGVDPGDDPAALHDTTSTGPLSHLPEGNKLQDIVAPCAAPDIGQILSTVNLIPRSNPTVSPAIVVSDDTSTPFLLLAPSCGLATAEFPSFIESASIEADHIPHTFRSPSPSITPASSHDTDGLNPPIPMTVLHSGQTAAPAHDIAAATFQPKGVQHELDTS